ncbi:MAG: PASTA domain-containing protein, partial [Christensenellales bacterium]
VTTAAPIFKTLAEKIIDYMNFEPTTVSIETNPLPDFTGYDISDAEEVLTRLGLEFKIVGTEETVVNQFPKGETAVYDKMEVILYTQ